MTIAQTILFQLGGQKFVTMTGSKQITDLGNGLSISLVKNPSGANVLTINYVEEDDLYKVRFSKFRAMRVNPKTGSLIPEINETIEEYDGVYWDQLQDLFTQVTGLDTHL